uniref:Uncharacterized protein n=1 Tax=Triticum urartu TaxID=4572 RepID=A0A8R7V1M4_TRIUA
MSMFGSWPKYTLLIISPGEMFGQCLYGFQFLGMHMPLSLPWYNSFCLNWPNPEQENSCNQILVRPVTTCYTCHCSMCSPGVIRSLWKLTTSFYFFSGITETC